jgi:hypothetical protein
MVARSPRLEADYLATRYEFVGPQGAATLRVNQASAALLALQRALAVSRSGLVSAWNPHSEPRSRTDNDAAHARLLACVTALGCRAWPSWHRAPEPRWDEPGLLLAGIDRESLLALGREFGQHAVLYAGADACPRLLWCADAVAISAAGNDRPAAPGTATSGS